MLWTALDDVRRSAPGEGEHPKDAPVQRYEQPDET